MDAELTQRFAPPMKKLFAALCASVVFAASPALADKFKRPTAVFAGLDKITGRIISFEVAIGETVQFGSLQITPRVCYGRPPTEAPRTDAFAEVDEVETDKTLKRLFTGWMFADSPGLHGVEHPVYDIWLTDCKGDGPLIKEAPEAIEASGDDSDKPDVAPNPSATPTPGATTAPKPKPKPRPKPKPAPDLPPEDVGRTPSRQFFPDDAAPSGPVHIGR